MGLLTNILSSGTGDLVKSIGDTIDNLTTSDQEKLEAKQKLEETIGNFEAQIQKEVTSRWSQDMNSDSWLSKNIRPMTLIFVVISTMLLIFIDAGSIDFNVKASWIDLLQLTLLTIIGAYFGGRSFEKIKKK